MKNGACIQVPSRVGLALPMPRQEVTSLPPLQRPSLLPYRGPRRLSQPVQPARPTHSHTHPHTSPNVAKTRKPARPATSFLLSERPSRKPPAWIDGLVGAGTSRVAASSCGAGVANRRIRQRSALHPQRSRRGSGSGAGRGEIEALALPAAIESASAALSSALQVPHDWYYSVGGELFVRMSQFAHGISALDVGDPQSLARPVWLLGRRFSTPSDSHGLDAYREMFESILWFTYRRDFAKMEPYEYTSDAGWGCMLRTAQMLLSQALKRTLLGRDWRVPRFSTDKLPDAYVTLLRWFVDSPAPECYYSIHHMVKLGMQYDKLPGEWYGPTTAALVLRDLVNLHRREFGGRIAMYVPQEGVVYSDDVMKLCVSHVDGDSNTDSESKREEKTSVPDKGNEDSPAFFDPLLNPPEHDEEREWATALLILIPLRLGLDQLNASYVPALEQTFAFPQSVGIIGGKKGHSVYFVGSQHDQLHLLDPHEVQQTTELNPSFPTATHLRTVHSSRPLVMNVQSIDPSLALGFLCQDRADYLDFCERVKRLEEEAEGMCPFSVASHRPDYGANSVGDMLADCLSGDSMNEDAPSDDDDEDYVLI